MWLQKCIDVAAEMLAADAKILKSGDQGHIHTKTNLRGCRHAEMQHSRNASSETCRHADY
jgi:hypothetical protein